MKKFYYLKTCDTCRRIIKELDLPESVALREIKSEPVTEQELEVLKKQAGSYESLFSRNARLYKERNLKDRQLSEPDYKNLILEHYTFLKRPVLIFQDRIFIGNNKKTVAAAKEALQDS